MDRIKESFDSLPIAACFFDKNGVVRLINRRMLAIANWLRKGGIQSLAEMQSALHAPPANVRCLDLRRRLYRFPDAPPTVEIGMAKSTEFTKTELKVLRHLLRGLSYTRIAAEMGCEMSTVKFHVANMLQKTGLENKLQLALAVSDVKLIVDLTEE